MSAFHNSAEGERIALKFHKFAAWVGVGHIGIGLLAMGWHYIGVHDHQKNLQKLERERNEQ